MLKQANRCNQSLPFLIGQLATPHALRVFSFYKKSNQRKNRYWPKHNSN